MGACGYRLRWMAAVAGVLALGTAAGSGGCGESRAPGPPLRGRLVPMGSPPGGYEVVTDLLAHSGRLYLAAARQPLGRFGAAVFATADGLHFDPVLVDDRSQGFLRIRRFDGRLYVPDADPRGRAPGRIWVVEPGSPPRAAVVEDAVHNYDVARLGGALVASGGRVDGRGGLWRAVDPVAGPWVPVVRTPHSRLKFLVVWGGRLLAAKRQVGGDVDLVAFREPLGAHPPIPRDVVPGEASTFRFHAASDGRLYWSAFSAGALRTLVTRDGRRFEPVPGLDGRFVSDFAERAGRLYALAEGGVFARGEGGRFERVAPAPDAGAFALVRTRSGVANADAAGALEAFAGTLWCGSTRGARLYRLDPDVGERAPPEPADGPGARGRDPRRNPG